MDYVAKARQGRLDALQAHQSGSVMFFPDDADLHQEKPRRTVTAVNSPMNMPMFVRSSTFAREAPIETPAPEKVANGPLVLSEDLMVENILKLAA